MSVKENSIIEIEDEELEKVTGGDYIDGFHKDIGFDFYCDSLRNIVYKIHDVENFFSKQAGYTYKIHYYISNTDYGYAGTLYDYQIDDYVKNFGRPQGN